MVTIEGDRYVMAPSVTMPTGGKVGSMSWFFMVGTTTEQNEANMELFTVKKDDMIVPCLRNMITINNGDKLLRYVAKRQQPAVPLMFSPRKRIRTKGS